MLNGHINNKSITKGIFSNIKNVMKENLQTMIRILIVVIIHSLVKVISENLGNDSTSKVIYFIQYVLIVTIVVDGFAKVIFETKDTICNLVNYMHLLLPLLITLMLTTGQFAFANIVEPMLLFLINFIGEFIVKLILPLVMICMVLAVVSNISKEIRVDKLSKFLKKNTLWLLGIVGTIFVTVLSLEGTLGESVDGLTSKTAKAVVSDVVPVVGKLVGDTAETIIGCSKVLKSTVGIFGVVVLLGIVVLPILKILTMWLMLSFTACLCEVVADEKIVNLIEQISDCYKILLGILFFVSVMLVIGITITIKATS